MRPHLPSPTRRPRSGGGWAARVAALGALLGGLAAAQEPAVPTVEEVQAQLEQSGAENQDPQAELYRQALASLKSAGEARLREQRFQAEAAEAPAMLESLHEELAAPAPEPQLEAGAELSLEDLEARLERAQAELAASRGAVDELANLGEQREQRKAALPEETTAAQRAMGAAQEALEATPSAPENEAHRTLLAAQVDEYRAQLAALEAERGAYDARREVLPLRRDRAQRRLARAERVAAFWKDEVAARRAREGEAAAHEADQQLEDVARRFPALGELAHGNRELAALRSGEDGLPKRITRAQEALERSRSLLEETDARFRSARRRITAGGLTEGMALTLRRDYEWLPSDKELEAQAAARGERLSQAQLQQIAIEEERIGLGDLSAALERFLARIGVEQPSRQLVETAGELLRARREAQDLALDDLSTLITVLYEHEELANRLFESVRAYRAFVEERILWVRSSSPNPVASVAAIAPHLVEMARAVDWPAALRELGATARARPGSSALIALVLAVLLAGSGFLRRKRAELGALVRSYRTDKYLHTVRALVQTVLLSLPLPLVLWTLGWLCSSSRQELVSAAGGGLREVAVVWLVLRSLRGLLAEKGVGQAHFRWPPSSLAAARVELRWFEPLAIALGFVVLSLDRQATTEWSDSVGRASFVIMMLALAVLARRLLHAESDLWMISPKSGMGLLGKTHRLWSGVAIGLPVALALAALFGYYYTALQFELRLRYSIAFTLGLVLANSLMHRWLFMARRWLAVSLALEARAKREEEEQAGGQAEEQLTTESGMSPVDADKVDIPAIDAQTRQLFKSSITLGTVLGMYFIWAGVLPALQGLDRVQLFPTLEIVSSRHDVTEPAAPAARTDDVATAASVPLPTVPGTVPVPVSVEPDDGGNGLPSTFTLADALLAAIVVALTSVAAKNLPALLELSLLQRLPLDGGTRYAISTILRYLILLVGLTALSRALGIGWRQVQWLAAALTFGLAFGLQEIFANFVSGLIILIERPVRVGDIVTVGNTEGRVTQLRMRATTILDWDRREYLVPNKEFITGSLINWTLSDPVTRIVILVGIAYGSDTEKARRLLLAVADDTSLVLEDPAPRVVFRSFGESSLDFELRVFIGNRDLWPDLVDKLHTRIDQAFRAANIEIAFPQRDVHIRSKAGGEAAS